MTEREKYVLDIERMKEALKTTKSEYLRRDYMKAIKRKERELKQYDRYRSGSK